MRQLVSIGVLAMIVAPAPAEAQEARAVKKIDDANRAAMEDYDILNFESARKLLEDALAQAKRAKLEKHPAAARTHLNLGIVLGGGLGDMAAAQTEFKKALEIDPGIKLPVAYKTPDLQKAFDGSAARPEDPAAVGIKHAPIDSVRAGELVAVTATVGAEVKAQKLVVHYRSGAAGEFTSLPMKQAGISGLEWSATIPADATRGESVQYFIEARGAGGKLLAATGNVSSPSVITVGGVDRGGKPPLVPEGPAEPVVPRDPALPPEGSGNGTEIGGAARARARRTVYVAVGVGTGAGYITGETEVSNQEVTCCVAPAPLHISPEIGFWVSPKFTLSLWGRLGLPIGANVANAASAAPAGFFRAAYRFGEDRGLYVHGDLGGGFIRHVVKLRRTSATGAEGDVDTYATGPLLVGGGAGYGFRLTGPLRFSVDLSLLAGIPVIDQIGSGGTAITPGFALHADLTLGIGLAF